MAKQVVRDPLVFGWSWPSSARRPWIHAGDGDAAKPRQHPPPVDREPPVMALGVVLRSSGPASPRSCSPRSSSRTFMVITMTGMQEARNVAARTRRADGGADLASASDSRRPPS